MSPRRAVPQKKEQGGLPSWVIIAAIVVIAVVVVVIGADFITKAQGPVAVPSVSGITSTGRTRGDPKSSVTFLEFSDFQ